MRKIMCVLVAIVLTLSSLLFTAPTAEIQAASKISEKTGQGAADFAKNAYNNGWKYVYGAHGQVITKEIVDGLRKTFPGMYTQSYYEKTLKAVGSRGVDCVGLLKAYLWWQGSDKNPKPTSGVAGGATAMYNEAKEKGSMSSMPDEAGIILFRPGHVGIYIGGGYVIDASGVDYGIKKNNQLSKWKYWFRSPYLTYSGSGSNNNPDNGSTPADGDVLKKGAKGEPVKKLQNRLKELGYFTGTVDGDFGSSTEKSVKEFQKKAGLTADGVAGQATQKRLYASDAPKAGSTPKPDSSSTPGGSNGGNSSGSETTYTIGSTGSGVTKLQGRLIELGYLSGKATGTYGAKTKQAVTGFQKAARISATGVADRVTQDKLYSKNAPKSTANTSSAVNVGPLTSAKPSGTLKRGDSGDGVKALQTRLKELGYITGTVDSTFGAGTEKAVKEFQEAAGLTADGVAGKTTLDKMFASGAPKKGNSVAYTKLQSGDTGEKVTNLQNRLKELGYFTDAVNGTYGETTTQAVKEFQTIAELDSDGVAGEKTQEKLFAADAPRKEGTDSSEPLSSEASSEPISSEPDFSSDDGLMIWGDPSDVTEITPSSDVSEASQARQNSQQLITLILIICIGAATIVILVIFFLEWKKKSMNTIRVIRKDDDQE